MHRSTTSRRRALTVLLVALTLDAVLVGLIGKGNPPSAWDRRFAALALVWLLAQVNLLALWGAAGDARPMFRLQAVLARAPALAWMSESRPAIRATLQTALDHPRWTDISLFECSGMFLFQAVLVSLPLLAIQMRQVTDCAGALRSSILRDTATTTAKAILSS